MVSASSGSFADFCALYHQPFVRRRSWFRQIRGTIRGQINLLGLLKPGANFSQPSLSLTSMGVWARKAKSSPLSRLDLLESFTCHPSEESNVSQTWITGTSTTGLLLRAVRCAYEMSNSIDEDSRCGARSPAAIAHRWQDLQHPYTPNNQNLRGVAPTLADLALTHPSIGSAVDRDR